MGTGDYFHRKIREMEYQKDYKAGRRDETESCIRNVDSRLGLEGAGHSPPLSNRIVECLRWRFLKNYTQVPCLAVDFEG